MDNKDQLQELHDYLSDCLAELIEQESILEISKKKPIDEIGQLKRNIVTKLNSQGYNSEKFGPELLYPPNEEKAFFNTKDYNKNLEELIEQIKGQLANK